MSSKYECLVEAKGVKALAHSMKGLGVDEVGCAVHIWAGRVISDFKCDMANDAECREVLAEPLERFEKLQAAVDEFIKSCNPVWWEGIERQAQKTIGHTLEVTHENVALCRKFRESLINDMPDLASMIRQRPVECWFGEYRFVFSSLQDVRDLVDVLNDRISKNEMHNDLPANDWKG